MILFDSLSNISGTGYGGAAKNFVLELLGLGVDVRTRLKPGDRAEVQIYFGQLYDQHLAHAETHPLRSDKLVFFTMFESTVLPDDWVSYCNDMADLVLVPSTWNLQVFREAGVTVPIEVVPLGVNPRDFPDLSGLRVERRRRSPGPFSYLWQGFQDGYDRKGGNLVEKAYLDLIEKQEIPADDVWLIKKSVPYTLGGLRQDSTFQYRVGFYENVIQASPQHILNNFFYESDVGLNPTSGEGFGLIPLEQMASGLPVITPYATGAMEYLPDPSDTAPGEEVYVPFDTLEMKALVATPKKEDWQHGRIERPTYEGVRSKIKWAYENQDYLANVGRRAAQYVRENYTYRHSAVKLIRALGRHFDLSRDAQALIGEVEGVDTYPARSAVTAHGGR